MPDTIITDYFYGDESQQFTYFRIPRLLITSPRFRHLSVEAKLLYGMMLDRMSLSVKNEWYDEDGRVYIYFTLEEICEDMNCGRDKAMKLLAELDTRKGVGLIERIKQGQGKPTKLYVKRFTTREIPPQPEKQPDPPMPPQEVDFADVQTSDFPTSRGGFIRHAEVEETDPSYNNINQTDFSHTDPSIYPPAPSARRLEMDRCDQREKIKNQIDYDILRQEYPYDDVDSMLELLVDVMTNTASTIRIGGQIFPMETVRQRFSQLDKEHIAYVIDSLRQTTTKINNIRAYLLTALYNAPVTIGPYYSAAVRHDFP
ncbi:MAG: replication initiator protein A [Ruminiclostridium sp.]|nr:replication initiator protein A [Ruminiclostridium sp.]